MAVKGPVRIAIKGRIRMSINFRGFVRKWRELQLIDQLEMK